VPVFDEENLVSCAGLVPVMGLAERAGLSELIASKVAIDARADAGRLGRGESGGQADVDHRRDGCRRGVHR
jgi:hypothetical protein